MQDLAAEGRTVFVSSHLMNEMEATAAHVIVIGRGELVADLPIAEITRRSARSHVHVVSPRAGELAEALERAGGKVTKREDGSLAVAGMDAPKIAATVLPDHIMSMGRISSICSAVSRSPFWLCCDSTSNGTITVSDGRWRSSWSVETPSFPFNRDMPPLVSRNERSLPSVKVTFAGSAALIVLTVCFLLR